MFDLVIIRLCRQRLTFLRLLTAFVSVFCVFADRLSTGNRAVYRVAMRGLFGLGCKGSQGLDACNESWTGAAWQHEQREAAGCAPLTEKLAAHNGKLVPTTLSITTTQ